MPEDSKEAKFVARFDRIFSFAIGGVLILVFLVLPLAIWLGKAFFGWQPPGWINQLSRFLGE